MAIYLIITGVLFFAGGLIYLLSGKESGSGDDEATEEPGYSDQEEADDESASGYVETLNTLLHRRDDKNAGQSVLSPTTIYSRPLFNGNTSRLKEEIQSVFANAGRAMPTLRSG